MNTRIRDAQVLVLWPIYTYYAVFYLHSPFFFLYYVYLMQVKKKPTQTKNPIWIKLWVLYWRVRVSLRDLEHLFIF